MTSFTLISLLKQNRSKINTYIRLQKHYSCFSIDYVPHILCNKAVILKEEMPRNQIATIAGEILKISIIYSFNCLTWRCSNTLSTSYSAAISSLPGWRLCLPQQLGEYKKSLSNNIPLNMSVYRHFSVWFFDIMMLRQGLGYFSRNGGLSHGKPVHSVLCEVLSHNAMEHWVNLTVLLGNNIIIKKTLSLTKKAEMLCY